MFYKIKNSNELLNKGDSDSREKVLRLIDGVLVKMDGGNRIHSIMSLDGDILTVGRLTVDLSEKENVYLVGAGKACNAMASAVCDILGDRLTKGVISVKIAEEDDKYCNTDVYVGGHPYPNEGSVAAAKATLELVSGATEKDLFISVISGGSSALYSAPVSGITFEEEREATKLLLKSGAKIEEINAVRRHISRTNGGRLAEAILSKGAQLINLIISDGVGKGGEIHRDVPVSFFGTPVGPDRTTVQDAKNAIINYNLKDKIASSIVDYIWRTDIDIETPKKLNGNVTNFVLDRVQDSCTAAKEVAGEMGVNIYTLTTFLEGESKDAGMVLSSIAREANENVGVFKTPCFIVASGETTTKVEGDVNGTGGPGHELVLGFALGASGFDGLCVASIDSEGTDGTTIFAGAIADSKTVSRLEEAGVNPYEGLRNHSCCETIMSIGDNIFTGNTGTNVCDFDVMYIPGKED